MASRRSYGDGCGIARAMDLVGERWALAGPLHAQPGRLEPLIPAVLPRQIETVAVPAAAVVTAAEPRCGWIAEFAP